MNQISSKFKVGKLFLYTPNSWKSGVFKTLAPLNPPVSSGVYARWLYNDNTHFIFDPSSIFADCCIEIDEFDLAMLSLL